MTVTILQGDCREVLRTLPTESVHCVVTSPPYYGLRDYEVVGQLGLETTPTEYLDAMVGVFREVRRVLRSDGTAWVNMGDSYANDGKFGGATGGSHCDYLHGGETRIGREKRRTGLKPKDLIGIPWELAFALRADGWWLRQDIIWSKPNPMPESVTDRCTKAHEYLFLLSKSERYFYDVEAIKEAAVGANEHDATGPGCDAPGQTPQRGSRSGNKERKPASARGVPVDTGGNTAGAVAGSVPWEGFTRNKRSVWTVGTEPFSEAHFATFPPDLIVPTILAATSQRGCCKSCGAGWVRVTREVETGKTQKMPDGMATYAGGHTAIHRDGREQGAAGNPVTTTQTIGWYPSCRCDKAPPLPLYPTKPSRARLDDESAYKAALAARRGHCVAVDEARGVLCAAVSDRPTVPAVILDPFGGAGTTGLVADRLQRNAILIELNPEYAAMARKRIDGDAPLFARAAEAPAV